MKGIIITVIAVIALLAPGCSDNKDSGIRKVKVRVTGIHGSGGSIMVMLAPPGIEAVGDFRINESLATVVPVSGRGTIECVFEGEILPTYYVYAIHDANDNNILDMNGSTPAEGFAVVPLTIDKHGIATVGLTYFQ